MPYGIPRGKGFFYPIDVAVWITGNKKRVEVRFHDDRKWNSTFPIYKDHNALDCSGNSHDGYFISGGIRGLYYKISKCDDGGIDMHCSGESVGVIVSKKLTNEGIVKILKKAVIVEDLERELRIVKSKSIKYSLREQEEWALEERRRMSGIIKIIKKLKREIKREFNK